MSSSRLGGYYVMTSNGSDRELLQEYVESHSEAAFSEFVRRHVDFVYSVAARIVGDKTLAEDVTQEVFVAAAQNASRLAECNVLTGWLHRTTRIIAANVVRSAVRRRAREEKLAAMQPLDDSQRECSWQEIALHLDESLARLRERDREVLLLRFFHGRTAAEIGSNFDWNEAATQKRIQRALEKLRAILGRGGVTLSAVTLGKLLSVNACEAAPISLIQGAVSAAAGAKSLTFSAWLADSFGLMSSSTRVAVAVVSLVAVTSTSLLIARYSVREASTASVVYDGKPIGFWLDQLTFEEVDENALASGAGYPERYATLEEAQAHQNAIKHFRDTAPWAVMFIGTNGIAEVMKRLKTPDAPGKRIEYVRDPATGIERDVSGRVTRGQAVWAIDLLKRHRAVLEPELVAILKDARNTRIVKAAAFYALLKLAPENEERYGAKHEREEGAVA